LSAALKPAVAAGALALVALLFYGSRLSQSPPLLQPAEVALARQAYSIAQTGRDLDGRLVPLYVHSEDEIWFPTVPAYGAVIATTIAPTSPVAVRWPSVVIGVIAILLVYRIGLVLFANPVLPLVAAILTMLTPGLYMFSRLGMEGIFPVPFVLTAVVSVLSYLESRRPRYLWAAGLSLGVGFFSSTTAALMMPIYLALMAFSLWLSGQRQVAQYQRLAAGFLVPLLVLVPWLLLYPASYPDTLGRWAIHAAHIRNPIDGVRAIVNWGSLTNRASIYWEFLNPAFLFFPADENSVSGTMASGPMLFPLLILLPFGIVRIFRTSAPAIRVLLLVGFVVAPLAAATFGEDHATARVLVMMPLAAIIAAFGVEQLWAFKGWAGRAAAVLLLVLVPLQFAFFHSAYLGSKVP
jgi:4-amino-4-deoxy-L-arabinose transferase-like glycosyltransferase